MIKLIATFFYTSLIFQYGKGTFASAISSLIVFVLYHILHITLNLTSLIIVNTLFIGLSVFVSERYTKEIKEKDPSEVVIDEVSAIFFGLSLFYYLYNIFSFISFF
jgi:phosphatidylglycerophosphatase A